MSFISARKEVKSTWQPIFTGPDPTAPLMEVFLRDARNRPDDDFQPTGLIRDDYLKLAADQIEFWKMQQDAAGAIIDLDKGEEWQYSTPAFAYAAAALAVWGGHQDVLEPAARAMDWAVRRLSERQAANEHEDFYTALLAHAYMLLKPHVTPERAARWAADFGRFAPYQTYRQAPGSMNWNIVSLSGEALLQRLGLRDPGSLYVQDSLAAQGHHFCSPYGLYLEGPIAYDIFPRLWLDDLLMQGYVGPFYAPLKEAMRRAAITSLFMQSPWGELPAGGRSAHHQWNEAAECALFEMHALQAQRDNAPFLAGVCKRAAHLAFRSLRRWIRPDGQIQIVKNWAAPAARVGYEHYSAESQYSLLPCAMLAMAYEYAAVTEQTAEQPAPADVGGYVLELAHLHKVFTNAGDTYVEIDTAGEPHYDATGLIRVHTHGVSPQLGPSDSLVAQPGYAAPKPSPITTGIGVSWKDADGNWRTLGEMSEKNVTEYTVTVHSTSPKRVVFDIVYAGDLPGVSRIIEHYIITTGGVELMTEIPEYTGPLRYVWPVLADDGRTQSAIIVTRGVVSVSQKGGANTQTFTPLRAQSVRVERGCYSNHNGLARLAVAEYPQGGQITLVIAPKVTAQRNSQ